MRPRGGSVGRVGKGNLSLEGLDEGHSLSKLPEGKGIGNEVSEREKMVQGNEIGSVVIEMGFDTKVGGSGSDEDSEKLGNQSQEHNEAKHPKDCGTGKVVDTDLMVIEYEDGAEARKGKVGTGNIAQERSEMGNPRQIRTPLQDCTNDLSIGRGNAERGYSTGTKGQ